MIIYAQWEGKWLVVRAVDDLGEPMGSVTARRTGPQTAYLVRVYVDAAYRRKGIASALRRHQETELALAGITTVTLDAIPSEGISQSDWLAALERAGYVRGPGALMTKKTNCRVITCALYNQR